MTFKKQVQLFLSIFLLFSVAISGQNSTEPLDEIRALDLDSTRYEVIVYHPKGADQKAKELGPLMADALGYYSNNFETNLDFRLVLLDKSSWNSLDINYPYGLPFYTGGNPSIAVIPSTPDGAVYNFMLDIKDKVSPQLKSEISKLGYSYEGFSAKMLDLVGFHEVGHAYMKAYGINLSSNWLNEFAANYLAYAFLRRTNPELADLWDLSSRVILEGHQPKESSLDIFNEKYAGVGVANYAWYQSRFEKWANDIFDKSGEDFIRLLKEEFPEGKESLDNNEELLVRLEKIEPGFVKWNEEFKEFAQ